MKTRKGISRRQVIVGATGASAVLAAGSLGFPAIGRAQADVIKFGHLTPRTGFLGPLGDYAVMAADMAVDEINAAGGVMGRKIELIKEDSVNPQTASTKAERMIERDKVACIVGEISSASCLTIAQVAQRTKNLFVNTGGNSDALRGSNCNRYMFHVESPELDVREDRRPVAAAPTDMVKGKKWYSLTADYAFGHDLLRVAKRFMEANGGKFAADELVPTDATDFSAILLKIRNAKPDLVVSNLAGNQITNFLKQYSEFGLTSRGRFRLRHRGCLGRGQGQLLRHLAAGLASPDRYARLQEVRRRLHQESTSKPPENQAWGDYIATEDHCPGHERAKSIEATKIIEHLEKGAKFDVLKTREGYFRDCDHQLMHEMYAVEALRPTRSRTSGTSSSRARRCRLPTSRSKSSPPPPKRTLARWMRDARMCGLTAQALATSREASNRFSGRERGPAGASHRDNDFVGAADAQRPAGRRLLSADRAGPVADLLARRHRQSRPWRVLSPSAPT